MKTRTVYRFGEFRLNPATHELLRGNDEVALPPKAFGCLAYLVENRDRAVGRDELISGVWGKTELSDSVVGQAIIDVRHALGDERGAQNHIKTVRGVGYRWIAPVDVELLESAPNGAETTRRRTLPDWLVPVIIGLCLLALGAFWWTWQSSDQAAIEAEITALAEGNIALLVPVTFKAGPGSALGVSHEHAWIRLGLMDLIAERLRAAGLAMVPSDTVIALMRGLPEDLSPHELSALTKPTGAVLVLSALAEERSGDWKISLQSHADDGSVVLSAFAESDNVLDAARVAADRIALTLGLTPAPAPDQEPGLALLLQQAEAAMLAQQMDAARVLIEAADERLRELPEVRLQLGWVEYHDTRFDIAEAVFESLLKESSVYQNAVLRARALHGLAGVRYERGDFATAKSLMDEATSLLGPGTAPGTVARLRRSQGFMALMLGDLDEANAHYAHVRNLLEGTGDLRGLAILKNNLGVLETYRERYAESLYYFESAANGHAALHDLGGELTNVANLVIFHLAQLEVRAAVALKPRLEQLLTQMANPRSTIVANLAKAEVLDALGELAESERALDAAIDSADAHDELRSRRWVAYQQAAERALRGGDPVEAARLASEVVEQIPADTAAMRETYSRAWLALIRARLEQGDRAAAADAVAKMSDWADTMPTRSPKIYAALAQAELAAVENRLNAAGAAYEYALALADESRIPVRILQVAESYVPWLLACELCGHPFAEHAVLVADRVARFADQHYRVALLQLRVRHALGTPSAWRVALERAQSLAGEHEIPPELWVPPSLLTKTQ